jgi:hypothetical protein
LTGHKASVVTLLNHGAHVNDKDRVRTFRLTA